MKKYYGAGMALGLSALSLSLHAEDMTLVPMQPYLVEMFNYQGTHIDDERQSKNGRGFSLGGGVPINKYFNIELNGSYAHMSPDDSPPSYKWNDYGGRVDGMFFYSRRPIFSPYSDLGLGATHNVVTAGSSFHNDGTSPTVDAGMGFISYFPVFDSALGIKFDARYRWTFVDDSKFPGGDGFSTTVGPVFHEPIFSVGLVIPLGRAKAAPPENQVPPPQKPPAKEAAKPILSPERKFDDVHFAFDKSNLTDYSKAQLDEDTTQINKLAGTYTDIKVDVSGHTDWIGTDAYNQALSERRANAVKDYLIQKGVAATRIRIYAYGESRPIAPNTTAEGRAANRRAEIRTTNSH